MGKNIAIATCGRYKRRSPPEKVGFVSSLKRRICGVFLWAEISCRQCGVAADRADWVACL
jgi:hypothetical protein